MCVHVCLCLPVEHLFSPERESRKYRTVLCADCVVFYVCVMEGHSYLEHQGCVQRVMSAFTPGVAAGCTLYFMLGISIWLLHFIFCCAICFYIQCVSF